MGLESDYNYKKKNELQTAKRDCLLLLFRSLCFPNGELDELSTHKRQHKTKWDSSPKKKKTTTTTLYRFSSSSSSSSFYLTYVSFWEESGERRRNRTRGRRSRKQKTLAAIQTFKTVPVRRHHQSSNPYLEFPTLSLSFFEFS